MEAEFHGVLFCLSYNHMGCECTERMRKSEWRRSRYEWLDLKCACSDASAPPLFFWGVSVARDRGRLLSGLCETRITDNDQQTAAGCLPVCLPFVRVPSG